MTASLLLVRLLRFRADELYTVVEEMSGLLGHDALQVTGIDRCCRRGSALLYALIHRNAWKGNSAKFTCRILHRKRPESHEARF